MAETKAPSKSQRLVSLLMFLSKHDAPVTREQIAGAVEGYENIALGDDTAAKQFRRDIETLKKIGVAVLESDEGKYFSLDATYGFTSPLDLERTDLARLSQIVDAAMDDSSFIYADDLRYAALKLTNAGDFARPIGSGAAGISGLQMNDDEVKERARTLDYCCRTSTRVSFRYRDAAGKETMRTVEPQGLLSVNGEPYLIAHDENNEMAWHFRLSRMENLKKVGEEGSFERIDFDPRDWITLPFSFGPEEEYPAVFLLSSVEIPDGPGYRDASFFKSSAFGDRLLMVAPCYNTTAAVRWALVDEGALPLAPSTLVETYRALLKKAEASHES